jgi:hypothetical protein
LKTLIIFGLSFVKQLAHGLVKRFVGYVTLLNAFVLICSRFKVESSKVTSHGLEPSVFSFEQFTPLPP